MKHITLSEYQTIGLPDYGYRTELFLCYRTTWYRNIEYRIGEFKKLSDYRISDQGLNLSDYRISDSKKTIGCPPLCKGYITGKNLHSYTTFNESGSGLFKESGSQIRIKIQVFDAEKFKNVIVRIESTIFYIKKCNICKEELLSYKRNLQPSKENIQHLKT